MTIDGAGTDFSTFGASRADTEVVARGSGDRNRLKSIGGTFELSIRCASPALSLGGAKIAGAT